MSLLELYNVSKCYSAGAGLWRRSRKIEAVKGVSLSLTEGTCMGLVGESGCGKTTLGKMVLGLERPDSGEVLFSGRNIHARPGEGTNSVYRNMQVVFQDSFSSVNPRLTAGRIIGEPVRNFLALTPAEEKEKVAELLLTVGLNPEDAGKYPHQFSGGQLQRICIARAISVRPKLIVLDEAVSSLDVSVQAQILNLLLDLKNSLNLSYIFISHDIEAVHYLSDCLAVMYLGSIVEFIGSPERLEGVIHPYSQKLMSSVLPPHPRHRRLLNAGLDEIAGAEPQEKGCLYAPRCSLAAGLCLEKSPPLVRVTDNHQAACHKI